MHKYFIIALDKDNNLTGCIPCSLSTAAIIEGVICLITAHTMPMIIMDKQFLQWIVNIVLMFLVLFSVTLIIFYCLIVIIGLLKTFDIQNGQIVQIVQIVDTPEQV